MIFKFLNELRGLNDAVFHEGTDAILLRRFERESGLVLPSDHQELLRHSNGVEAYAGYLRLFGLQPAEGIDSLRWNEPDFWKFAWGDRCSGYWCFGETAWGDQFAYQIEALKAGHNASVFYLDAFSMTPKVAASSFAKFLEQEFVRLAKEPYDAMTAMARQKLGPLDVTNHLVYVPSLLLGGPKEIGHVDKMDARCAMICNGDIAMQVDELTEERTLKALVPYEDELKRTRIRLTWR